MVLAALTGYVPTDRQILVLRGRDASDYLHRVLTCNVKNLKPGHSTSGALLTGQGKLIAPLHLCAEPGGSFRLVVAEGAAEALQMRLERYIFTEDVQVEPVDALVTELIGDWPRFAPLPARNAYRDFDLDGETVRLVTLADDRFWLISRRPPADLGEPLGEVQYTAWRIARGIPAWGHELDDGVIPLRLGIDDAFDHQKGCYTGQEVISRANFVGHPPHELLGVRARGPLAPASELTLDGDYVGVVTSSVFDEASGESIGLARLRWHKAKPGEQVRTDALVVEIVALPLD